MKKLILANFKAFGQAGAEFGGETSEGKPMNILCYGENGAGKSSVFEALKYVFHRERIERERIAPHLTGQARENARQQVLINYKNKKSTSAVAITINNQPYTSFDTSDYHVYMIASENLEERKQIDVKRLLKSMYLGKHDIDQDVTGEFFDTILGETNRVLEEYFYEDVRLEKSQNAEYRLKVVDEKQGLEYDDDLGLHFNEAKLHLINLLLALSSIMLLAPTGQNKRKILVLDDFITSLDTANRSFLYQYIISCFDKYQVLIFTHNTSFYNLCDHFLKENPEKDTCWLRQGIYEYNHQHYVYAKQGGDRLKQIEDELKANPGRVADIGNDVRQYFEVLLHQFAMMLMAGAREETSKLLYEVTKKGEKRIFHVDEHGISDLRTLYGDIEQIMKDAPADRQWEKVKRAIDKFKNPANSADKLSENLQAMSIYQKVALHQASHGHEGLPDLTEKEIKASIHVLRKLEETIKKMKIERI